MNSTHPARRARRFAIVLAVSPVALGATQYTGIATVDDGSATGNCTLREALLAVATAAPVDTCPAGSGDQLTPDEIVLLDDTYQLLEGTPIALSGRSLWIHGNPLGHTFVDLGGAQRFLSVTAGSELRVENVNFINGSVTGRGGAIEAIDSDLTLRGLSIDNSVADGGGGAISFETTTPYTLDLEDVELQSNTAYGQGGALLADLAGGGTVRIVKARVVFNEVSEAPPGATASGVIPAGATLGGGLAIAAAGTATIELRHLDLSGNSASAAADAAGGGGWIFATGGGTVVAEDLYVVGNLLSDGTGNDVSGLALAVHGLSLDLRRMLARANSWGGADDSVLQARIDVGIGSAAEISDVAVVSGSRSGLLLTATGGSCSLRAGNLTVAGHNVNGLELFESGGCTLTVENSIAAKNANWGFVIPTPLDLRITGAGVTVSAETMVGGEPSFFDTSNGDYRLASDSPAIDAGDQSLDSVGPFDVAHAPRVLGTELDLGAYEFGAIFADDFEHADFYAWFP